jgi:peptide/nickel transport system substrate-binding protein
VVLLGASMIAAACGSSSKSSSNTTTNAPATTGSSAGSSSSSSAASTPASSAAPAKGGTVTYSLPDKFTSYNNGTADDNLASNGYAMNQVIPNLAYFTGKTGDVTIDKNLGSVTKKSDTPLVVDYSFVPQAVWSDGQPISCDDIYLQWIALNGKVTKKDAKGAETPIFNAAATTGFDQVKSVDCSADNKTATVTYATPFSDWLDLITYQGFVPAHIVAQKVGLTSAAGIRKAYESNDLATLTKIADFWNTGFKTDKGVNPSVDLSGGPFMISSYTPDQSITLVRNPKYWGPPASADKIVMRIITDDSASAQALANGEVQVIQPQPDPDLLNQLKGISSATTVVNQGFTFEHFDYSFLNPLFQDLAVRQAVAYCVPRQQILDTQVKPLLADAQLAQNRFFEPFQGAAYKDNSGGLYDKVDIAKAKSTLEADGWKLNGGVYEKNGQKLQFKLMHKMNARRSSEQQLIAASCGQAGIKVIDDGDANWSTRLGAGQFDSVVFAWTASALQSANKPLYHTAPSKTNLLSNYGYYSNPQVDALMNTLTTQTDPQKLADAANQADVILWKDLQSIPLYQWPDILSYSKKVAGPEYNPTQQGPTWNDQVWAAA